MSDSNNSLMQGTLDAYDLPIREVLQGEQITISLFISIISLKYGIPPPHCWQNRNP